MVYFLIPVFNEEKNADNLFHELKDVLPGEEKFFVFSDDGSTDDSINKLHQLFANYPHIILGDGVNKGPGAAFNTGFEWILQNHNSDKDLVVTMEADCTSDIKILPVMVTLNRLNFDLVLASVYAQGGGFDKTTFLRKFVSSIANLIYRFLFSINVLTLSSFYRVYSIVLLKRLKEKYGVLIRQKGFICMLEILVKAVDTKARIIEVPMVLASQKRQGHSKMKFLKTMRQYFVFLLSEKRNYS